MVDTKDPAFKLFGKTIPLTDSWEKYEPLNVPRSSQIDDKVVCKNSVLEKKECMLSTLSDEADPRSRCALKDHKEDKQQCPLSEDSKPVVEKIPEEDQKETDAAGSEKALKKPDKILPCPRCNSMETKFCYYNNYNVNQPRHFCKNCQRYWTAGGTMRNVPVGAGRRKNKHTTSHYRHMVMSSDGTASSKIDSADGHHQMLHCGVPTPSRPLGGNGTVLKFGPDAPLCESMASVLNLRAQKRGELISIPGSETSEEASAVCSSACSTSLEKEQFNHVVKLDACAVPGFCNTVVPPHPLQCYGAPPWGYPWSPGWSNVTTSGAGRCSSELVYGSENGNINPVQWGVPPVMTPPAFCASSIPYHLMPSSSSYWSCMPSWAGGSWNIPLSATSAGISSSSCSNTGVSSNGSPTLGKHSREGACSVDEKPPKSIWVPKILRVDDPDEAAKSSIWVTLGIKPSQDKSLHKDAPFKSLQSKENEKHQTLDATQILQASPNPLAHTVTFQDSNI